MSKDIEAEVVEEDEEDEEDEAMVNKNSSKSQLAGMKIKKEWEIKKKVLQIHQRKKTSVSIVERRTTMQTSVLTIRKAMKEERIQHGRQTHLLLTKFMPLEWPENLRGMKFYSATRQMLAYFTQVYSATYSRLQVK
jgi:hypothetical protein